MPRKAKILVGQSYGRLKVIERGARDTYGHYKWLCLCSCGNQVSVWGTNLSAGKSRSCGCLVVDTNTTHGESRTLEYHRWANIKARCHDVNHRDYKDYGGRGIKMCKQWLDDYLQFKEDMGRAPSCFHTVERVDNEAGYNPDNCCWATRYEQAQNRRPKRKRTMI